MTQAPDRIVLEYDTLGVNPDATSGFLHGILSFFGFGDSGASTHGLAATTTAAADLTHSILASLYFWWQVYSIVALLVSALLLYGILYARLRLGELAGIMHDQLHHAEEEWKRLYGQHKTTGRYQSIEQHAASDNPNDWRMAIIEADVALEELLEQAGFHGTTIGDRLKAASPTTLHTLNDAWEAHKVRNQIAHKGGDFILTKRIANETIARYQRVFNELSIDHAAEHGGGHAH